MGAEMGGVSPKADPGVLRRGERQSYCKKASEKQGHKAAAEGITVQYIMPADLGPAWVLACPGCEPPGVEIERGATARVRITNPPWGMGDGFVEFLNPASSAAERHARRLGLALRERALVELGRRVRLRELAKREREAMLATRRDGGR